MATKELTESDDYAFIGRWQDAGAKIGVRMRKKFSKKQIEDAEDAISSLMAHAHECARGVADTVFGLSYQMVVTECRNANIDAMHAEFGKFERAARKNPEQAAKFGVTLELIQKARELWFEIVPTARPPKTLTRHEP